MPNFRGTPLHQRARDADLGGARPSDSALHLQLRGDEGAQRRPADALRLAAPALHRRRAAEGRRRATRRIRRRSPRRCSHRVLLACDQAGRRRARPVLRHRHDRRGGASGSAATSSASSASPPTPRPRASASTRVEPLDDARSPAMRRRSAPSRACRSARWSRRGMLDAGRRCSPTSAAAQARGARRRHARARRRSSGSIHKIGALAQGAAGLQRLDLLARRAQRRPRPDRCVPGDRCAPRWPHRLIWRRGRARRREPGPRFAPFRDFRTEAAMKIPATTRCAASRTG